MASPLINASRGSETGGSINRILSNSRAALKDPVIYANGVCHRSLRVAAKMDNGKKPCG